MKYIKTTIQKQKLSIETEYGNLWDKDNCYYTCNDEAETSLDTSKDIGWNSFPTWSMATDFDKLMEALKIYLEQGKFSSSLKWKNEKIEY